MVSCSTELLRFAMTLRRRFSIAVYSSVAGQPLHDLLPLPFTEEVVEHVARRVKQAESRVGRPLVLENATFMPICQAAR